MNEMKHIIYQITNLLNDMIYIGKHSTTTPYNMKKYWGSSDWLKSSIEIHGEENFKRETLFIFDAEKEAYQKEAEIVDENFIKRKDTYNLRTGGEGSFVCSEETRKRISESHKGLLAGEKHPNYGKHPSEETLKKQRDSRNKYLKTPEGKASIERLKILYTGKILSREHCRKIKENHAHLKGGDHPAFGTHRTEYQKKKHSERMSGSNHPMFGKHLSEKTKQKISENNGCKLSLEVIKQRRQAIKDSLKTFGWKLKLAKELGIHIQTLRYFIKNHALDLDTEFDSIIKQRRLDVGSIKHVYGYKKNLSIRWGISLTATCKFIKKYASDLVEK